MIASYKLQSPIFSRIKKITFSQPPPKRVISKKKNNTNREYNPSNHQRQTPIHPPPSRIKYPLFNYPLSLPP